MLDGQAMRDLRHKPSSTCSKAELKFQRCTWIRHLREASEDKRLVVKSDVPSLEVRWTVRHQKTRPIPHPRSQHQREGSWRKNICLKEICIIWGCPNYQERDKIKTKWVEMGLLFSYSITSGNECRSTQLKRGRKEKNINRGTKGCICGICLYHFLNTKNPALF